MSQACENSPPPSAKPIVPFSLSTNCGKKSASCSAIRNHHRWKRPEIYASVRLDIRRSTQIKSGDAEVMGNKTRVKVVKNKVAPPFRTTEFDIMYGEGISKMGEIIDLGVNYEIIKKSGSWFSYGDTKLGQGRDAVKALLEDNIELMEELETKIMETVKAIE